MDGKIIIIYDPREIVNDFNNHFSNICTKLPYKFANNNDFLNIYANC